MNQYEAMFLFDPGFGASFEACEGEIRRLMERAEAEILVCRQWDERRLAYRIKGRKRGVYVLVYFKAPPERIAPLQRDAQIAEHVLRLLVLRADGVTPEMMERAVDLRVEPAVAEGPPPEKPKETPKEREAKLEEVPAKVPEPTEVLEPAAAPVEEAEPEASPEPPAAEAPVPTPADPVSTEEEEAGAVAPVELEVLEPEADPEGESAT